MNNQSRTSLGKRFRTAAIASSAVDQEGRTVRLSISSDTPYLREDYLGQYFEILDHSPGRVVVDRLADGCAMLYNHDRNVHLGRGISSNNNGHRIEVVARFSRSALAAEKFQDVVDGVLNQASVGYQVIEVEEVEEIDGIPAYKVKWEPYEFSLVTVAADISVGVGREHEDFRSKNMETQTTTKPNENQPERTAAQERERINHIHFLANRPTFKRFVRPEDVQKAIDEGWSKRAFSDFVLSNIGEGGTERLITDGADPGDRNTPGISERIIAHPEARRMLEGGRKTVSFNIPNVRTFREALTRSTTLTGDVGTSIQVIPGVQGVAFERLTIADLLASGTTDSGTIIYPRENSFVPQATNVAEAAAKPEQSIDIVPDSAKAKKIAAWTKISDELLADTPAAAAFINNRLGFAVLKQEDTQLLYGDGLGANMRGILSTPGVQLQAKGGDIAPDAIRKAINLIDTGTDFMATGIVLYPTDFMNIELLKDTQGRYLVTQVMVFDELGRSRMAPGLWGKPIAISKSITPGTALVGAFSTAAQLFRRMGMLIEMTNCNEDDFKRNLITLRAELRAALAVYNGGAFCEVSGL